MIKFSRLLTIIFAVALISAALLFVTLINFWLYLKGGSQVVYLVSILFSLAIFFAASWFFAKISLLRKEKAAALRLLETSESKFKNSEREKNRIAKIFADFNQGIVAIDENEKIFLVNPRAKKFLGIKSKDLQGMQVSEIGRISGLKPLVPYFLSLNSIKEIELDINNFTVELSVIPLVFEDKNLGRMIVFRDVTRESLQKKQRAHFILSSAHQLKTSMVSAKWSLKMLLSGDFGKISKEQKGLAERLYKNNENLIFLAESLIQAEKSEENAFGLNRIPVDINQLVQSVISDFKDKIKNKKIAVKFEKLQVRLSELMLDKEKIEVSVKNLFDNALKYTDVGGSVSVFLDISGRNLRFKISDTGIGIPKQQQPKIFSKFFRASNGSRVDVLGAGLGLFIAKKNIEDHGGKIWFESEDGAGSSFYFTLPIKDVK